MFTKFTRLAPRLGELAFTFPSWVVSFVFRISMTIFEDNLQPHPKQEVFTKNSLFVCLPPPRNRFASGISASLCKIQYRSSITCPKPPQLSIYMYGIVDYNSKKCYRGMRIYVVEPGCAYKIFPTMLISGFFR